MPTFVVNLFFHAFSFLLSTGFIILVSVERYLAICHQCIISERNLEPFKLIGTVFLVSAVLVCAWIPFSIHYKTQWCINWPIENLYQDYPMKILMYNVYTWHVSYKVTLYFSIVILYTLILILASCVYMYARILIA